MSFRGRICALCQTRPSTTGDGEDVWPWWLKRSPAFAGTQFTTWKNGQVVTKRDLTTPRTSIGFPGVKLPACEPCNTTLNQRFEESARPLILDLMDRQGMAVISADESRIFAEWIVKTWLLLAHPDARHGEPRIIDKPWRLDLVAHDLYGWMINGASPPDVVSLWLTRRDDNAKPSQPTRQIPLPTVEADGRVIKFQAMWVAVDFFEANLVYHPHWPIDHPLETEGRAVRMWPHSGASLDLAALPPVSSEETSWLEGLLRPRFAPGTFGVVKLPPLSPDFNVFDVLDGVSVTSFGD